MAKYLIFFNQQWVGDHSEEWFESRGPTSLAVAREMQAAGVWVFGGGLDEEVDEAFSADATSGSVIFSDGPFVETKEHLGGFCVVDVPDRETAQFWAGRVAEGCGWPQEVRRFKDGPMID
ncbi:YciI family protein [Nocardioides conyzicola]|uniref:YciI family protein n=1 Tax=Nocardioides conyzicola TaxID=1651781 RepID=A0ABP8XMM3_9ACTN